MGLSLKPKRDGHLKRPERKPLQYTISKRRISNTEKQLLREAVLRMPLGEQTYYLGEPIIFKYFTDTHAYFNNSKDKHDNAPIEEFIWTQIWRLNAYKGEITWQ